MLRGISCSFGCLGADRVMFFSFLVKLFKTSKRTQFVLRKNNLIIHKRLVHLEKNGLCKNHKISSYEDQLRLKIDLEESIKTGKLVPQIDISSVGVSSLLGPRPYNEDRVLMFDVSPKIKLFGIFDGHGGAAAVDFIANNLDRITNKLISIYENDLPRLLKEVFLEINDSFIRAETEQVDKGLITEDDCSGSTATICVIRNALDLVVGHVGDTRATLCRSNRALRLTQDHKPDLRAEMQRIIKCNGTLSWSSLGKSRVNGRLEMTRSIGDRDLKSFGVVAEPDIVTIKIRHTTDSFLLLTTDGVHSRVSSPELVNAVNVSKSPGEGASHITDLALFYGSRDNCSAAILPLGAWGKFNPLKQQIIYDQMSFPRF